MWAFPTTWRVSTHKVQSTPRAFAQWTELGEASSGATVSGPPGVIGIALDSAKAGSGITLEGPQVD